MSSNSKRSCEEVLASSKTLLFDVEGTTTSISFVKDTLFPYVRSNLDAYVKKQWSSEEFKTDLTILREQAAKDMADQLEGCVAIPDEANDPDLQSAVVANVLWQMDGDRKTKALKQLQGHVMREGYEQGQLKGHLYSDVVPAMRSWIENGFKLYVYSSGSVEAQKMLFGHSEQGDLLKMFQGHFDTEVGSKQDVASYTSISKLMDCSPSEVVFFTDVPAEAKAAEGAGMTAVLVVRKGNSPLSEEDLALYQVIESFAGFLPESPVKRRKVSDDVEVLSADVEMTDVSEAPTAPIPPNILDKPIAIEVTNGVKTDVSVDADRAECKTPTLDERQDINAQNESRSNDIDQSKCNTTEVAKLEVVKPEEDMMKEVTEVDQSTLEPSEIESNVELLTPVENSEPTKLSSTADKAPSEPEACTDNSSDDKCMEKLQTVLLNKVESPITPVDEKAIPENSVTEEEKVTKMETAAEVPCEINKADVTDEVKVVPEIKEPPSPMEETKEKVEDMVTQVMPQGKEEIEYETRAEANGENGCIEKTDFTDIENTVETVEVNVEKEKCEGKNSDAEIDIDANLTKKISTVLVESEASEKIATDTNVEGKVAEKTDDVEKLAPGSEVGIHSVETKVETDEASEKTDLVDTKTDNDKEVDKTSDIVELGQGDAGTLVELSKNVDKVKDSVQVEEMKVKKILDDNTVDDTENAVPVTMET